jgi:hypothetical protein
VQLLTIRERRFARYLPSLRGRLRKEIQQGRECRTADDLTTGDQISDLRQWNPYGVVRFDAFDRRSHIFGSVGGEDVAYADPDAVDRRYHRSRPIVIDTDDPFVALYVHLGANPDGSQAYVGVSELERPFLLRWFEEESTSARSFVMPVDQADELRHALGSAVRVGRPVPVGGR